MSRISAILILGCNGYQEEDFQFCPGTNNQIIDLDKLDDETYEKMLTFFDRACGLFRSPVYDYNKRSNILNMLHGKFNLIDDNKLRKIQYYLSMHKKCQTYLALVLKEDFYG